MNMTLTRLGARSSWRAGRARGPLTLTLTLTLMLALALSACSDVDPDGRSQPWALRDPDEAPSPPSECSSCQLEVQTGSLPEPDLREPSSGPLAAGDRVFWKARRTNPDGRGSAEVIWSMAPGQPPRVEVEGGVAGLHLLAARGDSLLYWLVEGEQGVLIARFGQRSQVELGRAALPILVDLGSWDGGAAHMISDERAAAVLVTSGRQPRQTLVIATARGERAEYELPPGGFTAPFVSDQDVVLGAAIQGDPQAQTILWARELDQQPLRKVGARPAASQSSPVLLGQDVLWLRDGAVMRGDLMATREEQLLAGPCSVLDADGDVALASCGDEAASPQDGLPTGATSLYLLWPDRSPERVHHAPGHHLVTPRVSGQIVSWQQFPREQTFCQTPNEHAGYVMAMGLDRQGRRAATPARAFGPRVGAPCLCCGAYWPSPSLSASPAGVLTWRYDLNPQGQVEHLGGWAKLSLRCQPAACDP